MAELARYQIDGLMLMTMYAAAVDLIIMKIVAVTAAAVVTSAASADVVVVIPDAVVVVVVRRHPAMDNSATMSNCRALSGPLNVDDVR